MPSQVAQVVLHLEQGIAAGRYAAGRRLPAERTLAGHLQVSRATVREAIGLLVARGVLERRQGDGTYVVAAAERHMAEIWQDMARQHPMLQADLVEFRAMLEGRTAELAALRHDDDDRIRLQAAHAAVDAAYSGSDRQAQIRSDVAFHRAIADATHNPVFSYLVASLLALLHDHVQASLAGLSPQSPVSRQLRSQHDALLSAILARDAERARDTAGGHMDYVAVQLNALPKVSRARKTTG
ncbi:FCD domain-containing protein [Pseudoxanthomonas sp.]|uniref:FadR/GntR family transcriptional regulator n=1 Tax=Pseudoxanthomonas sp. TaxID=1871049 RepID=UPI002FE0AC43